MGGAALAGQALQGATNQASAGSSGDQTVSTGNKNFNFGNPNKGLYTNSTGAGALGNPVLLAVLGLLALFAFYYIRKKK